MYITLNSKKIDWGMHLEGKLISSTKHGCNNNVGKRVSNDIVEKINKLHDMYNALPEDHSDRKKIRDKIKMASMDIRVNYNGV